MRSNRGGTSSAVGLLVGLAKLGVPLLLIAAAAYLFMTFWSAGKGLVRVTSSVPGADILIGGFLSGAETDTVVTAPTGRQIVTVRKDNYVSDPEFAVVDVKRSEVCRVAFVLRAAQEAVTRDTFAPLRPIRQDIFSTGVPVHSVPPGAYHHERLLDVTQYMDESDDRSGSTQSPISMGVPPVARPSGGSPDLPVAPLSSTQITVSSSLDGAQILVNGQPSSHSTPYTFRGLDRGLYSFRVNQDGYIAKPDSIAVSLTSDFQRELAAFELTPDPSSPQPTLIVSTSPLAAGFHVDGASGGVGKATVTPGFGTHLVEFADVPGFKTPDPVTVSLSMDQPHSEAIGVYERITGSAYMAVVPSEDMEKFDGSKLRIFIDNELVLENPKKPFNATLFGKLVSGKRLVRVQYGDLSTDTFLSLMDNEVIELSFRIETFFSKSKLRLRDKPIEPIEQWQQRAQKLTVLTVS